MKQTVFVKVPVTELPPRSKWFPESNWSDTYTILDKNGDKNYGEYHFLNKRWVGSVQFKPTHWLREETLNCFTDEELRKVKASVASGAWDQCEKTVDEFEKYPYGRKGGWEEPNKTDYINSILNSN